MNKKKLAIGSVLTLVILLTGATVASAASGNNLWRGGKNLDPAKFAEIQAQMDTKKAEMTADREAMQAILDRGDYNAWKTLIEEKQAKRVNILDVINEDNFDKMVEMHNLKQAGDMEGAKAIADELGLSGIGMGSGHFAKNKGNKMPANN